MLPCYLSSNMRWRGHENLPEAARMMLELTAVVTLGGKEAHEVQVLAKWMMWPPLTCLQAPTPPSWPRTSCRGLSKYLMSIQMQQPTDSRAGPSHRGEGCRSWAASPLRRTSRPPSAAPSLPPSRAPEPWPWWLLAPEDTNGKSDWHNRIKVLRKRPLVVGCGKTKSLSLPHC